MKTIVFKRETISDIGGLEFEKFTSESIGGEYSSERKCLEAALGLRSSYDFEEFPDGFLELMLLNENIYVRFEYE